MTLSKHYGYEVIGIYRMRRALGTMPWKVPIACLAGLTVGLALLNLVGLIKVEMDLPQPRLIMLVVAYLTVMCGIRILHLKTLEQTRISLNCSPKQTQEEHSALRKAQTVQHVKTLQQSQAYKEWLNNRNDSNKSTIVYQHQSQSQEEPANVTCHELATMKKLF